MEPMHERLVLSAEWEGREYTTDPPRYTAFTVWSLNFKFSCALPIRLAHVLSVDGEHRWGLVDYGSERDTVRSLGARFQPTDWLRSDEVHLSFGDDGLYAVDADLKRDPRSSVHLGPFENTQTGTLVPLATVPRQAITLGAIAFAHDDTEDRRGDRWRVKPAVDLPPHLLGLASGKRAGTSATG
jgi:hypothetical protein